MAERVAVRWVRMQLWWLRLKLRFRDTSAGETLAIAFRRDCPNVRMVFWRGVWVGGSFVAALVLLTVIAAFWMEVR